MIQMKYQAFFCFLKKTKLEKMFYDIFRGAFRNSAWNYKELFVIDFVKKNLHKLF